MGLILLYSAFCILHSAFCAAAAPVPLPAPAPPPSDAQKTPAGHDDSEVFAQTLLLAVDWVANNYVRPVSRADLLQTSLTALYDAVGRSTPGDLRRRIDRAEKKAHDLSGKNVDAPPPPPLVPGLAPPRAPVPDARPVLELIRAVRAETGEAERMRGEPTLRLCCQAMLRGLDPYSGVVVPGEDDRALNPSTERDGFGLEVRDSGARRLVVKDVLPGGPAQRAGLLPGDEIVRVRDADGRERKTKDALDLLNGRAPLAKPGLGVFTRPEPIEVLFCRRGAKEEQHATLFWENFRPESVFGVSRRDDNSWNYWLDAERKIAHLRLGALTIGTPDELSEIVGQLRQEGMRGLILDLRWCPGGSLVGSVKSAELFLGEGTIATVRHRATPEHVYRSVNEDKLTGFPIVVLVNEASTGGAEMIAAALQDHHRAVLVGQRTHGKGNVQNLESFHPIRLKLTSGTIVRPSGKALHRFPDSKPSDDWGVHPDRVFRISPDLSHALKTWWEKQTLRSGGSTERLPLDDPRVDPQRNAAAETLTELLNERN